MNSRAPHWWAVTGAPGAGKTTLVTELAACGFATQPEIARELIDRWLANGYSLEDVRGDERAFHYRVARAKLDRDLALPRDQPIVFDRGILDSVAFGRYYGWPAPAGVQGVGGRDLYAGALLLDPLPPVPDYARIAAEDREFSEEIGRLIVAAYREQGVPVFRIPVGTQKTRLEQALSVMGVRATDDNS